MGYQNQKKTLIIALACLNSTWNSMTPEFIEQRNNIISLENERKILSFSQQALDQAAIPPPTHKHESEFKPQHTHPHKKKHSGMHTNVHIQTPFNVEYYTIHSVNPKKDKYHLVCWNKKTTNSMASLHPTHLHLQTRYTKSQKSIENGG